MHFISYIALAASLVSTVSGHALITSATGANGVSGVGFGVVDGTPRDTGLPIKKVEGDTSIIRDKEIAAGTVGGCGRTEFNGNNDVATQLQAADAAGLPTADASGTLSMTIHQVNQDGAGPFACDVSTDGGKTFTAATVSNNVPGVAGLSLKAAKDFSVQATVPAGTACAGGPSGNACIMRCRNQALAGPFGGCVAFSMGGAAASASAGNSTAAAASPDASAADAASASTAAAAASDAAAASTGAAGASAGKAAGKLGKLGSLLGGLKGGAAGSGASAGGALSKLFGRDNLGGARVAGAFLRSLREIDEAQH